MEGQEKCCLCKNFSLVRETSDTQKRSLLASKRLCPRKKHDLQTTVIQDVELFFDARNQKSNIKPDF